jgi:hypothetical protein
MKKTLFYLTAFCIGVLAPLEARGQGTPPPKVLAIFREDVKAGRGAAHENVETGYVRAMQRANWPVHYLAMTAVYGGSDALFLTAYDSFAALQKDRADSEKNVQLTADIDRMDAQDAEYRTSQRAMVGVLNPELTIGGPVVIPEMRYFSITTVRVRPGHTDEYTEARKILVDATKKANVDDQHSAFYSVAAGMPVGTYLLIAPRKSLAELDPNPARAKAIQDAMGEENNKKRQKLLADSVISAETSVYAFSPKMSYVPKEWAKIGGEFWTPKPLPKPVAVKKPAATGNIADKKAQ